MVQFAIKTTNTAAKKIKVTPNTLKSQTLYDVVQKIFNTKEINGGKLPHNFIPLIIKEMKILCLWLQKEGNDIIQETAIIARTDKISNTNQPRCTLRLKGGRPKVSTDESKKDKSNALLAATNEITLEYLEINECACDKYLENGTLRNLIKIILQERNLPGD